MYEQPLCKILYQYINKYGYYKKLTIDVIYGISCAVSWSSPIFSL